jgi:hypothetical protein
MIAKRIARGSVVEVTAPDYGFHARAELSDVATEHSTGLTVVWLE